MKAYVVIGKIQMECPFCDKVHEIEERMREATTIIKGEEVVYEERYYFCALSGEDENEFETGGMTNENLLRARNSYRRKKGLLTSDEIVDIRERYGLSQVDLAKLLGWGEATVSRYESNAIQDDAYDRMLRLVKDNPLQALELLKSNSDKFNEAKKSSIKANLIEKLGEYGKEYLTRQTLESEYASFDTPSEANGYTVLNIDKIEAIASYLARRMDNLYKVKLMKCLWYCDALSYKLYGKAVTGLVYRHEAMGALPLGHYSLMNLDYLNVKEKLNEYYESMLHVLPDDRVSEAILAETEKEILDRLIKKFGKYKALEMVGYMHKETAYTKTENGDIIPFSLAAEINLI